jgi:hypothetical protein
VSGGDYQFLYDESSSHLMYAIDYGECLPGGSAWSIASLAAAPPAAPDAWIAGDEAITDASIRAEIGRLGYVTDEDIAHVVAVPPDSWGLAMEERVALARFLAGRRDQLLAVTPRS